jgi:hypothetical protein
MIGSKTHVTLYGFKNPLNQYFTYILQTCSRQLYCLLFLYSNCFNITRKKNKYDSQLLQLLSKHLSYEMFFKKMFNQIDNTVIIWTDTTLSVLVLEQTDCNFLFVQTSTIKYTMTRKLHFLPLYVLSNHLSVFIDKYKLENIEGAIKNGQSRETSNIRYTRRRKTKQKHNTICVGHHMNSIFISSHFQKYFSYIMF